MEQLIQKCMKLTDSTNLEKYWSGFTPVAFAIYNQQEAYLFNHPLYNLEDNQYKIIKKDDRFLADTLILYDDYPTAIINMDRYEDTAQLFSIVIHELFHGYQHTIGENRFPNELLGVTYPILKENIQIRNLERKALYQAVLEQNPLQKTEYIKDFIFYRESRSHIIDDYKNYENLIETIEGPAWYVELKAYQKFANEESNQESIIKYGKSLLDGLESNLFLRKSCYSSGLFICLLLDGLSPNWHEEFFSFSGSLYDFFKNKVEDVVDVNRSEIVISTETESIIKTIIINKKTQIDEFNNSIGHHLFIKGEIQIKGLDPMNIVAYEKQFLHKNFVKVIINGKEYTFQQPCLYEGVDFFHTSQIHLVLIEAPNHYNDCLDIPHIGQLEGSYSRIGHYHYLTVS